ncbi:MAG: GDSL-type esterase/lipase family protein [Pseudomonadales bacterium]
MIAPDLRTNNNGIGEGILKMKNRMTSRYITIATIAACAFIYGLVVATYKVFPFEQIVYVKGLFVAPPDVAEDAEEAKEIERFKVYYLDKKSFFEKQTTRADIVMVGDSLVDGAEWAELLPNTSVVNRGIAGDSIAGVLNRMDSIHSAGAKKMFVMLGYNDLRKATPVNEVFANYKAVIENILARGKAQPYIQSTLFVGHGLIEWNRKIAQLNKLLELYAKEKDLVFIDLNAALAANGELGPAFTRDGIHLNGAGYELWGRVIKPYLGE